jgi:hypothetical protein
MNGMMSSPAQRIEILKARTKAFRFPKGRSGNPGGQSRFYHEARKIAREASPEAMRELVALSPRRPKTSALEPSVWWPSSIGQV